MGTHEDDVRWWRATFYQGREVFGTLDTRARSRNEAQVEAEAFAAEQLAGNEITSVQVRPSGGPQEAE